MNTNVSISHPTDRPNFSIVTVGSVRIGFSYSTAIHVTGPAGTATHRNDWGPTTGKHINWFRGDKAARVDSATFARVLEANMAALGASLAEAVGAPA